MNELLCNYMTSATYSKPIQVLDHDSPTCARHLIPCLVFNDVQSQIISMRRFKPYYRHLPPGKEVNCGWNLGQHTTTSHFQQLGFERSPKADSRSGSWETRIEWPRRSRTCQKWQSVGRQSGQSAKWVNFLFFLWVCMFAFFWVLDDVS